MVSISPASLLEKSQIVYGPEGTPSYALVPYGLFHSFCLRGLWPQIKKLSPSEEETLEILSTPGLAVELFHRMASAEKGETLSLEELKNELQS